MTKGQRQEEWDCWVGLQPPAEFAANLDDTERADLGATMRRYMEDTWGTGSAVPEEDWVRADYKRRREIVDALVAEIVEVLP